MNMRYNHEGYADPTAYAAMMAIEKDSRRKAQRPLVFISSPLAGDIEGNTCAARRYCRFAVKQGVIPVAPHLLYPQFMDDTNPAQRKLGIYFGLVLMTKCEEVWMFGYPFSAGMQIEFDKARARGKKIRFFNESCAELTQVTQSPD